MDEVRIKISLGLMKRLEAAAAADDRTVDEALLVAVRTWVEAIERRQKGHDGPLPTANGCTRPGGGEPAGSPRHDATNDSGAEEGRE